MLSDGKTEGFIDNCLVKNCMVTIIGNDGPRMQIHRRYIVLTGYTCELLELIIVIQSLVLR